MNNTVSILKASDYDVALLTENVRRHFEHLGGVGKYIAPGTRVLIKPNMLMAAKPHEAITTHPALVEALVNVIAEAGGAVTIADSAGGLYNHSQLKKQYKLCGMEDVAARTGAALNYNTEWLPKQYLEGVCCKSFDIIKPYYDADLVISVGKIKTHGLTLFTGATKNLFGLVPGVRKAEMHMRYPKIDDFCDMLVDLARCLDTGLCFMDAVVGMEGDGPSGGSPRAVGATLASDSTFALDVAASYIIGFEPDALPLQRAARRQGVAPASISELKLLGVAPDELLVPDFKKPSTADKPSFIRFIPRFLRGFIERRAAPRPRILVKKCVGCAKCAESCPQKIISMKNKKAVIDYSHCIKCFCCHEMCHYHAIDIKRLGIFRARSKKGTENA